MNGDGPSLLSQNFWAKREARCLAILQNALARLRKLPTLPNAEVELNRAFYFCLLDASRELFPDDELSPVAECCNQPDPDDQAHAAREHKRPDFQWAFLDRYEANPHRSSKQFVVECKRLGASGRPDWVLNENYTDHGIIRFQDATWAYAMRVESGVMVGYWQNMGKRALVREVNEAARKKSLPELVRVGGHIVKGVSSFEHTFDRTFEVTPFTLRHLWVDLRS